jgi:MoaA/NifB/PqqE/SkfB family radical SAM enzyme
MMQRPMISLDEVIWEITTQCRNGCSYCGSKNELNKHIPTIEEIEHIASQLAQMEVKEINFSGGDPLLVPTTVYDKMRLEILPADTQMKIVMSPLSSLHIDVQTIGDIFYRMNVIGMSINTLHELACARDMILKLKDQFELPPITVITNFNLSNMHDFEAFEEFVENTGYGWQIQFTIDEALGIYNNPSATTMFFDKLDNHFKNSNACKNTMIADNMNHGACGAGTRGIGILANGDVVPCLSMRSYVDEMPTMGNIHDEDLYNIWHENFHSWRCHSFKCCKDACKEIAYPPAQIENLFWISNDFKPDKNFPDLKPYSPKDDFPNQIVMYGVQEVYPTKPGIGPSMVYGVQPPTSFVYGVWSNSDRSTSKDEDIDES